MSVSLDSLYLLVTEAIQRAEVLEDLGAPGAAAAHLDVSLIEERIAGMLLASSVEGALARRGAVRAALSAGDRRRAENLIDRFGADPDADDDLRTQMGQILGGGAHRVGVEARTAAIGPDLLESLRAVMEKFHAIRSELHRIQRDHGLYEHLADITTEFDHAQRTLELGVYGVQFTQQAQHRAERRSGEDSTSSDLQFDDEMTMSEFLERFREVADRR